MVSDFPNRTDLPGGYKTGPPSDTSTYYNLWKVATNLVERCVDRGELGWQATGMNQTLTSLVSHSLSRLSLLRYFHGFKSTRLVLNMIGAHG